MQRRMRRRLFIIWYPVAVGLEAEGETGGRGRQDGRRGVGEKGERF